MQHLRVNFGGIWRFELGFHTKKQMMWIFEISLAELLYW